MSEEEEEKYFELFGLKFPVHTQLIMQLAFGIWIALALILLLSQYFFGYEMTNADIPGGLTAGFLLAYLISIIIR